MIDSKRDVESASERYLAKNMMKVAGEALWVRLMASLPRCKRVVGRLENGKVYSASISAETDITQDVVDKITRQLSEALIADEAFVFAPLSLVHAVEKVELCNNGMLRVVRAFDPVKTSYRVCFEVAAGRDIEVEIKVTAKPL